MQAEFATEDISFLGEQDGSIERQFKEKLVVCFTADAIVRSAYLAKVAYAGKPGLQVALCLDTGPARSGDLILSIGEAFKTLFSPSVHLDILFLSDEQVAELDQVAKRFYPNRS
jgi:hypothetical protein